ncbi:hypothetical protein DV735_g4218, partial [Chaetothyriales sp. CBS 134920]
MPSSSYYVRVASESAWKGEDKPAGSRLQCLNTLSASKWHHDQLVAVRAYTKKGHESILIERPEDHDLLASFRFDEQTDLPEERFWGNGEIDRGVMASLTEELSKLVTGPSRAHFVLGKLRTGHALSRIYGCSLAGVWGALSRLGLGQKASVSDKPEDDKDKKEVGREAGGDKQGEDDKDKKDRKTPSPPLYSPITPSPKDPQTPSPPPYSPITPSPKSERAPPFAAMEAETSTQPTGVPAQPTGEPSTVLRGNKRAAELPPAEEPSSKRKESEIPEEVSTSDELPGPFSETSKGEDSAQSTYVPSEEGKSSPSIPEDLTLIFLREFIRHVLLHLPQEQWSKRHQVEFDDQKLELKFKTQQAKYTSIDDGGLNIVRDGDQIVGRVAIIETKRALGTIVDGRPVLSDERFAQIVGQALSMRVQTGMWEGEKDLIPVICGARYYVRFFQVKITQAYVNQLESEHDTATEFIIVSSTKWFDLRDAQARNQVAVNITAIE